MVLFYFLEMEEIPLQITYHKQKSSTGRIRNGKLMLRISTMVSRREQDKHIETLTDQLKKSWKKRDQKIQLEFASALREGELLLSTGEFFQLRLKKSKHLKVKIKKIGTSLAVLEPVDWFERDEEAIEEALWRFLAKDQIEVAERRLNELREGWLDEEFSQVRFKQVMSRWGSCDKRRGIIMLSVKLLLVEPKLFDYVCVHELAHLRHADHSDLFWDCVSQKMPDWKVQRRRLRQYE